MQCGTSVQTRAAAGSNRFDLHRNAALPYLRPLHVRPSQLCGRATYARPNQAPAIACSQPHQQRWRASAAAQETLLIEEPFIEFLGVLNDGMQTVKGVLHVAADADLVYSILTDYDGNAKVFRNIEGSQTIITPDGLKQVEQVCKWRALALSGRFNVRMSVTEEPATRLLVFRLEESSFMKDFEGRWQVQPTVGGCSIEHVLAVKPMLAIPAAIAPYTSAIFKQQVAVLLQDLEREIARQTGAQQAAGN